MGRERNEGSLGEKGLSKVLCALLGITRISRDIAYGGLGATLTHCSPSGHSGPTGAHGGRPEVGSGSFSVRSTGD